MSVLISSGNGNLASAAVSPKRIFSSAASFVASTFVLSITMVAVGLCPVTGTGVVFSSHERAFASGLSCYRDWETNE